MDWKRHRKLKKRSGIEQWAKFMCRTALSPEEERAHRWREQLSRGDSYMHPTHDVLEVKSIVMHCKSYTSFVYATGMHVACRIAVLVCQGHGTSEQNNKFCAKIIKK